MQAIRYHGQKDIRLETVDVPICGQGQVKVSMNSEPSKTPRYIVRLSETANDSLASHLQVKPAFVGICGSGKTG